MNQVPMGCSEQQRTWAGDPRSTEHWFHITPYQNRAQETTETTFMADPGTPIQGARTAFRMPIERGVYSRWEHGLVGLLHSGHRHESRNEWICEPGACGCARECSSSAGFFFFS